MTIALLIIVAVVALVVGWHFASRHFSLPCPVWLRWLVEIDNPFTRTNRAAVILSQLELKPGMIVLDMGCGPGRLTIPLAQMLGAQGRVVAVDIQAGMLRAAQARAEKADLGNIEFVQAGAGEGKLGEARFDRALLVTVLGEIPDRQAAMNELFVALKPGGILSVTELIFDPHFQRCKTVQGLARNAGFREGRLFGNAIAFTLHLEKPTG